MINLNTFRPDLNIYFNAGLSFAHKEILNRNLFDMDVYLQDYHVNLQRHYVWDILQQRAFILSLLRGLLRIPITLVCIVSERSIVGEVKRTYKVIDGKQRLTTLYKFIDNEFCIQHNGLDIYYSDLDNNAQLELFRGLKFDVYYSYYDNPVTDKQMVKLFEMINFTGTKVEQDHMDKLLKKIAE